MSEEKITDLYEWGNKENIIRPNVVNENLPKDISVDTIKVTTATTETENATNVNATNVKTTSTETKNLTATGDIHLTNPHIQGGINTDVIQATNDLSVLVGDNEIVNVSDKIEIGANIQPNTDASLTLGSKTKNFKSAYTSRIYDGTQEFLRHRSEETLDATRLSNDVSYLQLEHDIAEDKNHLILVQRNENDDSIIKNVKFVDINLNAFSKYKNVYHENWSFTISNAGETHYSGKQIWLHSRYFDLTQGVWVQGSSIECTDSNVNLKGNVIQISGKLDVIDNDINIDNGGININGRSLEDAERSWDEENAITLSSSSTTINLSSYTRERFFRYVILTFETLYNNEWIQVANTILFLNQSKKIMVNYPTTLTFNASIKYNGTNNELTITGDDNTRVYMTIFTTAV